MAIGPVDHDALRAIDALALDFANALLDRERGVTVANYADLMQWLIARTAVAPTTASELQALMRRSESVAGDAFSQGLRLAGEIDAMFSRRLPTLSADIAAMLRSCVPFQVIDLGSPTRPPSVRLSADGSHLFSALCPVLSSLLDLSSALARQRVKVCADVSCGKLFLDRTRNASRIWCSMNTCGSRAKVRTFRMRHAKIEESALPYILN